MLQAPRRDQRQSTPAPSVLVSGACTGSPWAISCAGGGIPMAQSDLLLQRLLEAESAAQVEELVAANLEAVLAAFPGWTTVPAQIRADPAAVNRYGSTIIRVARLLKAEGHPGPL